MYLFTKQGVPWPPAGFKHLSQIKKTCGQAVVKDPLKATIKGLQYNIEVTPLHSLKNQIFYAYDIDISGWDYSIYNESQEYPILSYRIIDDENGTHLDLIKVKARPITITTHIGQRTLLASLFLMKQISLNNVPDFDRILQLYRILPKSPNRQLKRNQAPIYRERPDSLFCGLNDIIVDDCKA